MSERNIRDTGSRYDQFDGKRFAEWPRELQAVQIVLCLHDHDPDLSDEFIDGEVERLGLLGMSDDEVATFVKRHLHAHHD